MTEVQLQQLVCQDLKQHETLGEQGSNSGHLVFVSYTIDTIETPAKTPQGWQITYHYTIITETEFTYYPDNPPYEQKSSRTFFTPIV